MAVSSFDKHAIVLGASGINGWAFVNSLINDYSEFTRVTALTNRPLSTEAAQWPESEKLRLISGIDLIGLDQESLETAFKERVSSLESVTHVFFCAYTFDKNPEREIETNILMLKKAVVAVEKLGQLEVVMVPTGVKEYGVHLLQDFPFKDNLPLKETHPRIPEPYCSQLFYTHQRKLLKELSRNKKWTYFDVRPDIIVGFVPNNSLYNLLQWVALYLSLYRYIHGEGAEVVFPGTKSWDILSQDSGQDVIARFSIYLSLHPEISAEDSFNVADYAEPTSWSVKWPIICRYFGLKGVGPAHEPGPDPAEFLKEHQAEWLAMEKEFSLQSGYAVDNRLSMDFVPFLLISQFDFDRQLDLTKMHKAWGDAKEERSVEQSWFIGFDRYRKAKIIP